MARRYDSSTTTFSPEGRLHQVRRRLLPCVKVFVLFCWSSSWWSILLFLLYPYDIFYSMTLLLLYSIPSSFSLLFFLLLSSSKVEYAIEAINNAGTCVGILAKDGIVMASERRITSGLLAPAKVKNE